MLQTIWTTFRELLFNPTTAAMAASVLRLALIAVVGVAALRLLAFTLHRMEALMIRAKEPAESVPGSTRKRAATLTGVLRTIGRFAVWTILIIIGLDQIGINVAPILAGAGIAGLAIGFGAQNLVRDVISGFFLILEDQVHVGDVAVINGTGGLVEAVTFRTIVLRDLEGVVHIFPNGTINTLANRTKEWSAYVIDMGVAYKEDTDRVVEVMGRVARELRRDPALGPKMLDDIEIFGVDNFADSAVIIKARLRTLPLEQWNVGREYRRRLKKAFDAEGIEIPFPQRAMNLESTKPLEVLVRQAGASG
ncbi:MAG: mechanosensitive ion channel family protein [Nitrospirota bacterium]